MGRVPLVSAFRQGSVTCVEKPWQGLAEVVKAASRNIIINDQFLCGIGGFRTWGGVDSSVRDRYGRKN